MDHIYTLRAQIEQLEAEVQKDPRLVALDHMKAALTALEGGASGAATDLPPPPSSPAPVESPLAADIQSPISSVAQMRHSTTEKPSSKIGRCYDLVGAYIDEHGPTHRSTLVQLLIDAGEMAGIKNPVTNFSTSMHTLKRNFISDGKGTFRRHPNSPAEIAPLRSEGTPKKQSAVGNKETPAADNVQATGG